MDNMRFKKFLNALSQFFLIILYSIALLMNVSSFLKSKVMLLQVVVISLAIKDCF